jgi:hypothetical protein
MPASISQSKAPTKTRTPLIGDFINGIEPKADISRTLN